MLLAMRRFTMTRMWFCQKGTAAVETALVMPAFFIALIFGITKVSLVLWTQASLNFAAEAAARCSAVNTSSCGTPADVQTYALSHYFGEPLGGSNPFIYSATGCGHTVTASYTYTLSIPVAGSWGIPLSASACFP